MSNGLTDRQPSEDALKLALDYAENIIDTLREPFLVLNGDLRVRTANRSFFESFQVSKRGNGKSPRLRLGQRTMGHSPPPHVAEPSHVQ